MATPIKIGIVGCAGRMGRMLIQEVLATKDAALAAGSEQPGAHIGEDMGTLVGAAPTNVRVVADAGAVFAASSVVIDFTAPAALPAHTKLAAATGKALIVGTTGLGDGHIAALKDAAKRTVIVQAANFSLGVNVLLSLTEKLAFTLGPEYDIEVLEMHHRHKVDAPSGTALALGASAARGRGKKLNEVWRKVRDGQVGARPAGEIGFATLRGGDVFGDHTVIFAGEGERVEVSHKASSRSNFARGAVRAAMWSKGKESGFYSMRDVLGL